METDCGQHKVERRMRIRAGAVMTSSSCHFCRVYGRITRAQAGMNRLTSAHMDF